MVNRSTRARSGSVARPPADYRSRLRRRIAGAVIFALLSIVVALLAVRTVWGQGVDTMLMESIAVRLGSLDRWESVSTGLVTILNIVLGSAVVAGVAVARRRRTLAGRVLGIIVIANVVTQVVKWLMVRPDLGLTIALPNSLPSGHVAVVASLAVALVIVSPDYLRSVAVWIAWAWVVCTGVVVMAQSWHRLADVVVSVMIVGACALLLAPIESQPRHFIAGQRVMFVVVVTCAGLAVVLGVVGLWGVSITNSAQLASHGYGFVDFLQVHPLRASLLAASAVLWVVTVAGVMLHEVDRLRWPLTFTPAQYKPVAASR